MDYRQIQSTADLPVPPDPTDQVIGQKNAVEKVKLAVQQRRHLLLVGPPGVGKSMLAKAMALRLPKPKQQINVKPNPENPQRPLIETLERKQIEEEKNRVNAAHGRTVTPKETPTFVAERLGFRCSMCGTLSEATEPICPNCGTNKQSRINHPPNRTIFNDIITDVFEIHPPAPEEEVHTTQIGKTGHAESIVYQRLQDNTIRVLNQTAIEEIRKKQSKQQSHILIQLDRPTFVHATGASETELLGDVRHDPYGSHPEIGTPPHLRVVAGAIHEAHEGVLFIDELPTLKNLQNFILTAIQEKKFPITGRNPQSAGASVKVTDVPCDLLIVGACNIGEVADILPPLRSRIIGNGYEVLLETTMPDTPENREALAQFIAREITVDGRIPHATPEVVDAVIEEARKRALEIDNTPNSLTLRLRDLGGAVRMAGDFAVLDGSEFIEKKHIKRSLIESRSIEHQLQERYGSLWEGLQKDSSIRVAREGDKSYL